MLQSGPAYLSRKEIRAMREEAEAEARTLAPPLVLPAPELPPVEPQASAPYVPREAPVPRSESPLERALRVAQEAEEERRRRVSARPSRGVRPFMDFHSGQARAARLAQLRGREPALDPVDVLHDRAIEAQQALIADPTPEALRRLRAAERSYELATSRAPGSPSRLE